MKGRKFLFLAVVAIVLGGLAYMTSVKRRPSGADASSMMGQPVLDELQDTATLNSIAKIVFRSATSTVTVARVEGTWVAPDRYQYPIDFNKVRGFLRTLRNTTVGHTLSAAEAQLAQLDLLDPQGSNASADTGTRLELYDAEGRLVTAMIIGKEHRKSMPADRPPSPYGMGAYPDGRYVRVDQRAFLIAETLQTIPEDPIDWMDTQVANVASADIEQIMISDGNQSLSLRRPSPGAAFRVPDLAKNEEMDTSKVNSLANTLSHLTFVAVADPALSDEELGFNDPAIFSVRNKNNQVYTLKLGGSPDGSNNRYARLSASYMPPPEEEPANAAEKTATPGDDASTENAADDEAAAARREPAEREAREAERRREIEDFNARVEGWTYVIPSQKATDITVDRAAFVSPKEEEEGTDE